MRLGLEFIEFLTALASIAAIIVGPAQQVEPGISLIIAFIILAVVYNIHIYQKSLGLEPPPYWVFPTALTLGVTLHYLTKLDALALSITVPLILAALVIAVYGRGMFLLSSRAFVATMSSIILATVMTVVQVMQGKPPALILFPLITPIIEHIVFSSRAIGYAAKTMHTASHLALLVMLPPYPKIIGLLGFPIIIYIVVLAYLRMVIDHYSRTWLLLSDYVLRSTLTLLVV